MKVLNREDLIKLIQISKIKVFDIRDFGSLLNRFGDEYHLIDGRWTKTKGNIDREKYFEDKQI